MSAPQERANREAKLREIRDLGIDPFPSRGRIDLQIGDVIANFEELLEKETKVTIAGRMMSFRSHGGSSFADIVDSTGRIQLYFSKN